MVTTTTYAAMTNLPTATLAQLARTLATGTAVQARLAAAAQQILAERATVATAA